MFSTETLKNHVAFITGGAGDIGYEIASMYGRFGAKVAIVGRNRERLDNALQKLRAQGIDAAAFVTDVRDFDQVKHAIEQTVARFGALDILVNNAAGNFHCPTAGLTPNGWKTVIDIDLNGTFHGCLAAYEHLKRSEHGGNIISIITMLGVTGWPGAAHAAAAKAGILSLSRTLAVEWGDDNIRVNTISPGPIGDTEGVQRMYIDTGRDELERRKTALNRFGTKADIAHAAVYLASDMACYVTGDNLVVDGGRWLKYVAA
ncbi:SDR family oxidoreductase [Verticiella sediminum]|uniref:SDR family oxidoreductase n=1 Tax=Verticiella sediminum TaxID=1247510 RepID=A0A556AJ34_9BURK|nr:SDR family oxidoreductase [Verticiella sediminum]TSH92897.1 SDR family oxidoreductase [Verticiella sediminum]